MTTKTELLRWFSGKEPTCQCRRPGFHPWVRTIPWRKKWQPTPVFLPGKSHGQRSLVGYSLWGRRKVKYERLNNHHQNGKQKGGRWQDQRQSWDPDSMALSLHP